MEKNHAFTSASFKFDEERVWLRLLAARPMQSGVVLLRHARASGPTACDVKEGNDGEQQKHIG
jgi:hypothetical protein